MTWLAIAVALASLGVSGATWLRNKVLVKALERERAQKLELRETLVEVLDEEGNIRGRLALPGEPVDAGVKRRLALAEKSVSTIQDEIREQTKKLREDVNQAAADLTEAKGALKAALSREADLEKTLAEVVDGGGRVLAQLRLPGKKVNPPNRTPCGDMCKLAFFDKGRKDSYGRIYGSGWKCTAGQGKPCDEVRSQFVDAEGQCVLWIRDDDVPAEDGTMPSKDEA